MVYLAPISMIIHWFRFRKHTICEWLQVARFLKTTFLNWRIRLNSPHLCAIRDKTLQRSYQERPNNAPGQSVGWYDVGNSVKVGGLPPRSPPKLKLAPEVMNYFNEFTGVTRWRLVDYRGLSNLQICIKHECPCYRATARELPHARMLLSGSRKTIARKTKPVRGTSCTPLYLPNNSARSCNRIDSRSLTRPSDWC